MKKLFLLIFTVVVCMVLFACSNEKKTNPVETVTEPETFSNPVANGADPFVFKDNDGTYYMYMTSGGTYGYRVYTSKNLVEWEAQGYCLRRDDVFTDNNIRTDAGKKIFNFWAPEIIKEGDTYYMVYTAQEHIGIATADSPLGPFKNDATSYLIPEAKNIDGHFFKDDDGKLYLYFVSAGAYEANGDSVYMGNNIWGGPFDLDSQTFAEGYPRLLVPFDERATYFEYGYLFDGDPVAEGPEMLKYNGKYYLTYSASGYTDPKYAVHYAVSDSPTGPFVKYENNPIFVTDDRERTDTDNPHLYGTAHHSFTTSPDGSELIIVYHAHRGGTDPNGYGNSVEERRICLDLAWFDDNGVLHAGRNVDGVPSATEQVIPSGGTLSKKKELEAPFDVLSDLPTVYVAYTDGNDEADGTKNSPLKTFDEAYARLENGGTIILTQTYTASVGDYYKAPAVNGPIMIKGEFSAVPIRFKFYSLNSDTYFENICFWPETANHISVIECNFNNVVMGEGVSCIAQPIRRTFPYLTGGKWSTKKTGGVYENYKFTNNSAMTLEDEFTLTVLSGTWTCISEKSLLDNVIVEETAPNGTVVFGDDVKILPERVLAPTATKIDGGVEITFDKVANAKKYVIYRDGKVIGYTEESSFVDNNVQSGVEYKYSVAGYVNGACIGEMSPAVKIAY